MDLLRKSGIFVPVLIAMITVFAPYALACKCVPSGTVASEMDKYELVALVKAKSHLPASAGTRPPVLSSRGVVTLTKVYSGSLSVGTDITLQQAPGSMCGFGVYDRDIGSDFIMYLNASESTTESKTQIWRATGCSRSGLANSKYADIAYLEDHVKRRNNTRLFGTISRILPDSANASWGDVVRSADHVITISGNGQSFSTRTDASGFFEIYDIPAGKYSIRPAELNGYEIGQHGPIMEEVNVADGSRIRIDLTFTKK